MYSTCLGIHVSEMYHTEVFMCGYLWICEVRMCVRVCMYMWKLLCVLPSS